MGQYRCAGELFLALSRDDPAMLYFTSIPLRWLPAQTLPTWKEKPRVAGQRFARRRAAGREPVASTADRNEAVKRLQVLTKAKDPRIAALPGALIWNATFASASSKQLNEWSDEVETFPDAVRAGPYYVFGRALAQHKQPAAAVLDLLRVPILYPEDRLLAAAALFAAARALEEA